MLNELDPLDFESKILKLNLVQRPNSFHAKFPQIAAAALLASCSSTVDCSGAEAVPRKISTGPNLSISVAGGDHEVNIIKGSSKVVNFTVNDVG